jgi:hypothetical protein
MVLLGDPSQLEQPQQGVHPPGTDVSALDHLLDGHATIAPERGLFLDRTWRLHPDICAFTSELFYEHRLEARPGLERQAVRGAGPLTGSGLRYIPVEHTGNTNESSEEVDVVASLVASLTDGAHTWVDDENAEHALTLRDVLVVTPYNAQVAALAERLPRGARVGTVDKFQGQEAPVVIYSMATSSADDAPRGMAFLYSPAPEGSICLTGSTSRRHARSASRSSSRVRCCSCRIAGRPSSCGSRMRSAGSRSWRRNRGLARFEERPSCWRRRYAQDYRSELARHLSSRSQQKANVARCIDTPAPGPPLGGGPLLVGAPGAGAGCSRPPALADPLSRTAG